MSTPFGDIMRRAVELTPGAVGGAFADKDGETIDFVTVMDRTEWKLLTAHYGVVLGHVQDALLLRHFGEAEVIVVTHNDLDILVQSVQEGYFALLALSRPGPLGSAMLTLGAAVEQLRAELT